MNELWQFQICSNEHETPLVLMNLVAFFDPKVPTLRNNYILNSLKTNGYGQGLSFFFLSPFLSLLEESRQDF